MSDLITSPVITRRRFLATSAALVGSAAGASTLLSACDASSSGTSSGGSAVTLTVMYQSNEFSPAYVKEFEKLNPGIKIKFLEYDATRLNAMLAAGTPPDFIRAGAVGSANANARGLALALDPYLEKSSVLKKDDLLPINAAWRWDGKQTGQGPYYGISKDWSQDATLWYNQMLLDKAKIPAPSSTEPMTYDQLFSIAQKLTTRQGGKVQVYGFGPEWQWGIASSIFTMITQQNGKIYNSDLTQIDFTTPEAQKALTWYVNYMQANIGPSSLNPLSESSDGPVFLGNRMAITQDGYWFGGNIYTATADLKASARLAPAPQMGPNRFSPAYAGIGAWIPNASKHKDEAWKLMEYFMAGTPGHDRAKSGWGIPSLKSLLSEMPQVLPYQQEAYKSMQNELNHVGLLPDSPYSTIANYETIIDKYLEQAAKKQISVTTASQKITDEANKLLQQGKQQLS
ncbi:MAG: sugar ABC transporter substrate-binding protein [Ktedonobacteraceae bacterium]|nr:sugar ABC transporter substrate-binding protein [Ktedonobacteraceae bacterium]